MTRKRAMSVCTTSGCPELTYGGRCERCQAKARAERRAKAGQRSYASTAWRRTRRAFLRSHPYCECRGCAAQPLLLRPLATEVDHIDGLGPLGPRGHDWTNLRAMTHEHHARETGRSQPGGWNDRG